jgi:hypothetical protein
MHAEVLFGFQHHNALGPGESCRHADAGDAPPDNRYVERFRHSR